MVRIHPGPPPAPDVHRPGAEIYVADPELDKLRRTKTMPIGKQDHRVVPCRVALASLRGAKGGAHLFSCEVVAQSPVRCHAGNIPDESCSSTPAESSRRVRNGRGSRGGEALPNSRSASCASRPGPSAPHRGNSQHFKRKVASNFAGRSEPHAASGPKNGCRAASLKAAARRCYRPVPAGHVGKKRPSRTSLIGPLADIRAGRLRTPHSGGPACTPSSR